MNIKIINAIPEDFTVVKNLVAYYIYDMSEFMGWNCNTTGQWNGCGDLPDYWEKPNHHPYLIKVNENIAGFAMVRRFPNETQRFEIGEFFVIRKFKGQGVGKFAAFWLFNAFSGLWIVRVLDENSRARGFCRNVISEYTDGNFKKTSETYVCPYSGSWPMQYYRFNSKTSQQKNAQDN